MTRKINRDQIGIVLNEMRKSKFEKYMINFRDDKLVFLFFSTLGVR